MNENESGTIIIAGADIDGTTIVFLTGAVINGTTIELED